ncbi:hypothetical protein [Lysobacter gummosus]|uniref:hypothetical protein n=1 Tax=Lysobacter gummosus TaxID=262324 RepID=UPI00362ECC77
MGWGGSIEQADVAGKYVDRRAQGASMSAPRARAARAKEKPAWNRDRNRQGTHSPSEIYRNCMSGRGSESCSQLAPRRACTMAAAIVAMGEPL